MQSLLREAGGNLSSIIGKPSGTVGYLRLLRHTPQGGVCYFCERPLQGDICVRGQVPPDPSLLFCISITYVSRGVSDDTWCTLPFRNVRELLHPSLRLLTYPLGGSVTFKRYPVGGSVCLVRDPARGSVVLRRYPPDPSRIMRNFAPAGTGSHGDKYR